jgi:drug/metabolite transporter (DMT)-like permease
VVASIASTKLLFVLLLAVLFLKEKLTAKCVLALSIGIPGAYIIIKPEMINFEKDLALLYAFIPPVSWALYDCTLKKQAMRDPWAKQTFLTAVASTIISMPFGLYYWQPISLKHGWLLILISLLSSLNKVAIANALSRVPLVMLASLDFARLIFVAIFAYVLLGEHLTISTMLGFCLITTSTLIIVRHDKHMLQHYCHNRQI